MLLVADELLFDNEIVQNFRLLHLANDINIYKLSNLRDFRQDDQIMFDIKSEDRKARDLIIRKSALNSTVVLLSFGIFLQKKITFQQKGFRRKTWAPVVSSVSLIGPLSSESL